MGRKGRKGGGGGRGGGGSGAASGRDTDDSANATSSAFAALNNMANKHVDFKTNSSPISNGHGNGNGKAKGLRPSPSMNTLSRLEREHIVIWRKPHIVFYYAVLELLWILYETFLSVLKYRLSLVVSIVATGTIAYFYHIPGPHQPYFQVIEAKSLWYGWWVLLGVLSSVGLGTGLHTFLLYLGPFIAAVTLAAYECGSLAFPQPPYPHEVICPSKAASIAITLWDIVAKVRWESLAWGLGTAIGELPPYFMARAAKLSGIEPDDEEYREYIEIRNAAHGGVPAQLSFTDRFKVWLDIVVEKMGFFGILALASIPNPFFDFAGIACGHCLVPFWKFFGATAIGKAIFKMHIQMLFVVVAFSDHHVEQLVSLLSGLPYGDQIDKPFRDFLAQQKTALHRKPGSGSAPEQKFNLLAFLMACFVGAMVCWFTVSIINSLAQAYHKRLFERTKAEAIKKRL